MSMQSLTNTTPKTEDFFAGQSPNVSIALWDQSPFDLPRETDSNALFDLNKHLTRPNSSYTRGTLEVTVEVNKYSIWFYALMHYAVHNLSKDGLENLLQSMIEVILFDQKVSKLSYKPTHVVQHHKAKSKTAKRPSFATLDVE